MRLLGLVSRLVFVGSFLGCAHTFQHAVPSVLLRRAHHHAHGSKSELTFLGCAHTFQHAVPSVLIRRAHHHAHGSKSELTAAASSSSASTSKTTPSIRITARRPSFQSGLRYRSNDWLKNFLSLPYSFVLRRVRFHLLSNVVLSVVAVVLYSLTERLAIPLTGHSLMGGFLSLLLVFRTNTAYARFYEARGVWSSTKSTCRNLALSIATYMHPHSPESAAKLLAQLAVFPKALTHTCMAGSIKLADDVKEQIKPKRATSMTPALLLCAEMHKTAYQAIKESSTVKEDRLEALHLNHMSHLIDKLVTSVSACEKIVKTPVPWSYSRHTSRFLTLWAGTLPFALVGSLGWFTIPLVTAACWCLFGIEEIGHLIEQPFGCISRSEAQAYDVSLPVDQFATQMEAEVRDIASMMEMDAEVKDIPNTSIEAEAKDIVNKLDEAVSIEKEVKGIAGLLTDGGLGSTGLWVLIGYLAKTTWSPATEWLRGLTDGSVD